MKPYTDLEQSKKLAKILPHKTADNTYERVVIAGCNLGIPEEQHYIHRDIAFTFFSGIGVPCWSLAALIDILPIYWWEHNKHYFLEISKMGDVSTPNEVRYYRFRESSDGANFGRISHISFQSNNLIDACVVMIEHLHEKNFCNYGLRKEI